MKKKILSSLLVALLVLSMAACGKKEEVVKETETPAAEAVEETKTEASEETKEETKEETTEAASEANEDIEIVDKDLTPEECVELCDYKNIEIKDPYVAPAQEDIDAYMDTVVPAESVTDENATIQVGDIVNVNYRGTLDGVEFEGGTGNEPSLEIGSDMFIDGFEEGMIGMKKGEEKDLNLKFPEDYGKAELAGKEVVFTVAANDIKRRPELTDEWVKESSGTDCKTVEEFKAYVKETYENNARISADAQIDNDVWEKVFNDSKFTKLPKSYIDKAKENFDKINMADAEYYGVEFADYLEAMGVDQAQYEQIQEEYALDSAKNTILCYAIWNAEKMDFECEEYTKVISELEEQMGLSEKELREEYGDDTIESYGKTYAVIARIKSYVKIV